MSHQAINIARYLISKNHSTDGGELISNMKLQKLLYYCQGFYYAYYKKPLFDENIMAWQYGPVVPEVYHEFKWCGSDGIPLQDLPDDFKLSDEEMEMVDDVFEAFGQYSAIKLMEMTHNEAPWKNVSISDEIKLEHLDEYFQQYLN